MVTVVLACIAWIVAGVGAPGTQQGLTIEPPIVQADMFFRGATVRAAADVPADHDVAFLIEGRIEPLELKRKGKVLGFLWMNVSEVRIDSMPSVYLLATSAAVQDLAPPAELERHGIGSEAVRLRAMAGADDIEPGLFGEVVELKASQGLFAELTGAVTLERESPAASRAEVTFRVPAKTPLGDYRVRVVAFEAGVGSQLHEGTFSVQQVGLAHLVASLAERHGLLYGLAAVIIALGAGLGTGLVFGLGSKRAH